MLQSTCRTGSTKCQPEPPAVPAVQSLASQLLCGDYALLPLVTRLRVLRCLAELALISEVLRSHIEARLEALTMPKPHGMNLLSSRTFYGGSWAGTYGRYGWSCGGTYGRQSRLGRIRVLKIACGSGCTQLVGAGLVGRYGCFDENVFRFLRLLWWHMC